MQAKDMRGFSTMYANAAPLISVIIPVYNLESCVHHALSSVCGQTYENLEILVVDDGSTDSSREICEAWAEKDSRIRVISQENSGLSAARNTGIENASGEYIFFLDGDDFLDTECLEILKKAIIEFDVDIAAANYRKVSSYKGFSHASTPFFESTSGLDALLKLLLTGEITISACGKLYKTSLWEKLRFPIGRFYEDTATIPIAFSLASRAVVSDCELYGYVARAGSITANRVISEKKYRDLIAELQRLKTAIEEMGLSASTSGIDHFEALTWLRLYRLLPKDDSYISHDEMRKIKACLKRECKRWRSDNRLSRVERARFFLFSISPTLYSMMFFLYAKLTKLNVA